jgi:Phosphodiester glycosidase
LRRNLARGTAPAGVLIALLASGVARAGPTPVSAVPALRYTGTWAVWPGVVFRAFQASGSAGPVLGDLLDVDLRNPHVTVGLLHPPVVAAREPVSLMADTQHAVAGVNGDFFNISEVHPGVPPTGSAVGPEIANGRVRKGAVPDGQRFGPLPPAGATTEEVIGVGSDRTGRLAALRLTGSVSADGPIAPLPAQPQPSQPPPIDTLRASGRTRGPLPPYGRLRIPLRGLNQYALPVGGVGAFTGHWGPVSRLRAVCGTDTVRRAPCSADTAEVTVRHGAVTRVGDAIGAGTIPPDTTVLVGREAGAGTLRRLRPGDRARVAYHLAGAGRLRFAVGGFAILRNGRPPSGLDAVTRAARTAAGVSRGGRHLYLVVVNGRSAVSTGLTLAGLSTLLRRVGADDAMNLDGGGSSTFALRAPGEPVVSVRNLPSGGRERAVANGIGVFVRH